MEMDYQHIQRIAVEIVNILAEKDVSIELLDVITDEVKIIAMRETKIKKIDK